MLWPFSHHKCTNNKERAFFALSKVLKTSKGEVQGSCPQWNALTFHHKCTSFLANQKQFLFYDLESVTHSPACFSMKTTSRAGAIRAKLIYVVCTCTCLIYSHAFGENVAGVAYQCTYTHQLLSLKLVMVTLRKNFCRNFVTPQVTMDVSICANFRSQSKTTKLVQISIGLPERASKKCSYWNNQLFYVNFDNFFN